MAFLPPPNLPLVPQSGIYDRRGLQKKYASPVRGRLGGGTGKPSPHPSLSRQGGIYDRGGLLKCQIKDKRHICPLYHVEAYLSNA